MDEEIKTYYKYQYTLGEDSVHIQEYKDWDDWSGFVINIVNSRITRLGESRFFMYSDSADNKELFMEGIAKILDSDMDAMYRAYELASGRFYQFNKFWKEQDKA